MEAMEEGGFQSAGWRPACTTFLEFWRLLFRLDFFETVAQRLVAAPNKLLVLFNNSDTVSL